MAASRSFGWYLTRGILLAVAMLILSQLFLAWRAHSRLSGKLASLRADGQPTALADLKPRPTPDEANAAAHLEKLKKRLEAFEAEYEGPFRKSPAGKGWIDAFERGEKPTAEQIAAIKKLLESYPDVREGLQAAAKCPVFSTLVHFDQPPSQIISGTLSTTPLRSAARFMAQASSASTAVGDYNEAVRLGIESLRLSRMGEHEPFLVNFLVCQAAKNIAIHSIADALQQGPVRDETRALLNAELAQHDPLAQLRATLRSERVLSRVALEEQMGNVLGFLFWPNTNWQIGLLDLYDAALQLADAEWHQNPGRLAQIDPDVVHSSVFAALLAPSIEPTYQAANRTIAQLRCLRILNALTAHKQKHGAEATGLADLRLPASATLDPFSGKPLLLKRTDKGWIVYSVMENGVDDGGDFTDMLDYGIGPPGHEFDSSAVADDADEASEPEEPEAAPTGDMER